MDFGHTSTLAKDAPEIYCDKQGKLGACCQSETESKGHATSNIRLRLIGSSVGTLEDSNRYFELCRSS